MEKDPVQTPLYKSIMAGLATGIAVTIISLVYNYVYRLITHFSPNVSKINVATISFACILLCLIAGLLHYLIVTYWHKSDKIFMSLFIVVTIAATLLAAFNSGMTSQFEGLYIGIVIITGICAAFLIPWFSSHKNVFF